jgi:hypothetical protein
MRTRIPTLIVSAVGGLSFALFGLSAPAQAVPLDCASAFKANGSGSTASCSRGTGYVRAKAQCVKPTTGVKVSAYGSWVRPTYISIANCPSSNPLAIAHTYQVKE